jgi:hypothetical protein
VPQDKWGYEEREQRNAVAKSYVLLLPELKKDDDDPFGRRHYFITSNWEEMNVEGNIVRYQLTNANY